MTSTSATWVGAAGGGPASGDGSPTGLGETTGSGAGRPPDGGSDGPRPENDLRCVCGSLMARRTAAGIELKCRRCRRGLLLRLAADGSVSLHEVNPDPEE